MFVVVVAVLNFTGVLLAQGGHCMACDHACSMPWDRVEIVHVIDGAVLDSHSRGQAAGCERACSLVGLSLFRRCLGGAFRVSTVLAKPDPEIGFNRIISESVGPFRVLTPNSQTLLPNRVEGLVRDPGLDKICSFNCSRTRRELTNA